MTTPPALTLGDRRRGRILMWLLIAALAAIAIATAAVVTTQSAMAPTTVDERMFPGLGEAAANAAQIRIEGPELKLTLVKAADGRWTVAERDGYPANLEGVRALIVSLADLTLIERRTGDPARHAALQLTTGEGGAGYAVTVLGADGGTLAAMVAGRVATPSSGTTQGTLFVRRAGEDQVWLARGIVAVPASVGAALDKTLFTIDRDRIKSARFEPHDGAAYTLSRADLAADYTLDPVPEGQTVEPLSLLAPATAVAGLGFTDVAKAGEMTDVSTATFETFDGLVIRVALMRAGDADATMTIEASVDAEQAATAPPPAEGRAKPDPTAEAAAINAKVAGWAYAVPGFVAANLMPPIDSLLKAAEPPADGPETPGEEPLPETPLEPAPDPGPPPPTPQ